MEPQPTTRPYRSRWSRDGTKLVTIGKRDIELFQLLDPNRHRYLRGDFINAFTGGNPLWQKYRLADLHRAPNYYLSRPVEQRYYPNELSRSLIYGRDERATKLLASLGRLETEHSAADNPREFAHTMMIEDTLASIELGARSDGVTIMYPKEFVERPRFPEKQRLAKHPLSIPVEISYTYPSKKVHTAKFDYTNDGIRGLIYPDGSGRFIQLEAEHTNRVYCSNLQQTSFLKKHLALRAIMQQELYRKYWGIPNLLTLVVAPNRAHLETIKKLVLKETDGKGVTYLLFGIMPSLDDPTTNVHPMPELFTQPWERVGYPPLSLNQR